VGGSYSMHVSVQKCIQKFFRGCGVEIERKMRLEKLGLDGGTVLIFITR